MLTIIISADMLYNLRRGTAPRVPSHRHLVPLRDSADWAPDPRADFLLGICGSGFREVQCPHILHHTSTTMPGMMPPSYSATTTRTVDIGLEEEILTLLGLMAELTVAFDHYIRHNHGGEASGMAPRNLDFFVNNADLVAHRLMSLGSLLDPEDPHDSMTPAATTDYGRIASQAHRGSRRRAVRYPRYLVLREISRRAAMVFQDMVIFPTPARTGVKLRHARAMLPLLRALRPSRQQQAAKQEAQAAAARKYAVPGGLGYDYLLGEDIGRLHLHQHPHHHGMGGGYYEDELEVEVVYDGEDSGEPDTERDAPTGKKLLHDRTTHLSSQSMPGSSTNSPSHHGMTPPPAGEHQHHHHDEQQPQLHRSPQAEADFLTWATTLGAIATRFTPLQDAYVAQLAVDVEHSTKARADEHFTDPAMGPCHYPQEGGGGGDGASWQEHKNRLMRFLWLDAVCDEPGSLVWEQALAYSRAAG